MPEENISTIQDAFTTVWDIFKGFIGDFIVALLVFVIGWVLAVFVGKVLARVIKATRVDSVFGGLGLKVALDRAGLKLDTGKFIGELVKWFIIIAALLAATDILGLGEVSAFLREVLAYIPNIIVAALILIATALVANFLQKTVKASIEAADLHHGKFIGAGVKWIIWVFGILVVLKQLDIETTIIDFAVMAFIAMLALSGGLAFGLGGKEFASEILDRLRREASNR